jgi:hypothetical protein
MDSKWYLWNKKDTTCSLSCKADKINRAFYDNEEDAKKKVEELDYNFRFGSTRHFIEKE